LKWVGNRLYIQGVFLVVAEQWANMEPVRTTSCLSQMKELTNIPGDVLELGVAFGVTSVTLASWLKSENINKKVYACDTFQGLPCVTEHDGKLKKGAINWKIDHLNNSIVEHGVQDYIIPVVGKIEDTLPDLSKKTKFCFVFFDLDIYESTVFAIKLLVPLLPKGAVMGFHDYGFHLTPGIKKAVDEADMSLFTKLNSSKDVLFFSKV